MLQEEQARELLARCEAIVGKELSQVRGNLRRSVSRSAALFELIVLEEAAKFGRVEYEAEDGPSPDIRLTFSDGQRVWIEVAFLYHRFWREEEKTREVVEWILQEAGRRGIPADLISFRFDGDRKNPSGPVRTLPHQHEKSSFLRCADVLGFFDQIDRNQHRPHARQISGYSIVLSYQPSKSGIRYSGGGGLVQEAAREVKYHSVYRVLKEKARQHDISGPRIICIGSDQSPALSDIVAPGSPTYHSAVGQFLRTSRAISAVLLLRIMDEQVGFGRLEKAARKECFENLNPRFGLPLEAVKFLRAANFNRWKYSYPLGKVEPKNSDRFLKVTGTMKAKVEMSRITLEIPANLLVDSLAGKTNLLEEFVTNGDLGPFRCLTEGWTVSGCTFAQGDVEKGEAPKIVLQLIPPLNSLYW